MPPNQPHHPEHPAVARARNNGDYGVLAIVLAITFVLTVVLVWLAFVVHGLINDVYYYSDDSNPIHQAILDADIELEDLKDMSVGSQIALYSSIAVGLIFVSMIFIRVLRQIFLSNYLHIEFSNYAWLRDWANQVSRELNMPYVEIFVAQDPWINAYALGFMRPYNIVLNSATVRYLTDDELRVVVLHEMGHIKYDHTKVGVYIGGLAAIPGVGFIFRYLLNFFYRRAEYTCDSLAYYYFNDPDLVKKTLVKVHVGPDVADSLNETAHQWQQYNTRSTFNAIVQTFFTHPFLVRRLTRINQIHAASSQPQTQQPPQLGSVPHATA